MEYRLEYPDFADALYHALGADPFYQRMARTAASADLARPQLLKYLDYSMREARRYGELYLPDGHKHGVSVWLKPLPAAEARQMKQEKSSFLQTHLGADAYRRYSDIAEFMLAKASAVVDDSCWYLSIIGILPEFQNRGLGAALVKPVLQKTDALGIATYLETFDERNQRFYRRLGYRAAASFYEPTVEASYTLMMRP